MMLQTQFRPFVPMIDLCIRTLGCRTAHLFNQEMCAQHKKIIRKKFPFPGPPRAREPRREGEGRPGEQAKVPPEVLLGQGGAGGRRPQGGQEGGGGGRGGGGQAEATIIFSWIAQFYI